MIGALLCAIVVIIGACCGQDAAEDGLRWLWRCIAARREPADSESDKSGSDDDLADGGGRDDEETGLELETAGLLSGDVRSRSDDNFWTPRLSPRPDDIVLRRRHLLAAAASPPHPGHQRKRSVDSSGEFFSPSAALTDSSASSSGADGFHSVPATPRLVDDDILRAAPVAKERRDSAVWTPSPSLERLRTV